MIGPAFIAAGQVKQFLADFWKPAFPCNAAKLAGDFSIVFALRERYGIFGLIHENNKLGQL
jgi:hypothetical protein